MYIPDEFPSTSVKGKRVVITGASRGLGSVLATAFSREGARVVLVGRNEGDLKKLAVTLPGEYIVHTGDVRDEEFNDEIARSVVKDFGGVDVWIANAGISPALKQATELSMDTWRTVLDTNLTGALLGMCAAARVMEAGGRIIATSSVLGQRSGSGLSAYNSSKAALDALVRTMAVELGPREITVNGVAPGWFDSPLTAYFRNSPTMEDSVLGHTALGRWGTGADLPGLYLFLASAAAAFMTGVVIPLDGGYLLA
ncbi:MAG: SDR family oxidoreductase [Acidimicrobiales bacterium]